MKVLALGGAGAMGRHMVKAIEAYDFVEQITVAGLDDSLSRAFVESLSDKVSFQALDVTNEALLDEAMSQTDFVVNAVGPFYRFAQPIVKAAIRARKPYIDICDDVEPTLAVLELDALAKAANVPVVVGLGASPGITNLLGVLAIRQLDDVHTIDTVWDKRGTLMVDDGFLPESSAENISAVLMHSMHCCTGTARIYENGTWKDITPLEVSNLETADGISVTGWSVAHPEAVTFPHHFKSIHTSRNYMTGDRETFEPLIAVRDSVAAGEIDKHGAAKMIAPTHGKVAALSLEAEMERYRDHDIAAEPFLVALSAGTKDGRPAVSSAVFNKMAPGGMGAATGIPAAIGVKLFHEGKLTKPGVHAPEGIVDPDDFFTELEPYLAESPIGLDSYTLNLTFTDSQ